MTTVKRKLAGTTSRIIFTSLVTLLLSTPVMWAQTKTVKDVNQVWIGYISSTKINNHYSLWNDIHLVPHGFFIARTGLTRTLGNVSLTGGYAFLLIPVSTSNNNLTRIEHRPWAQLYYTAPAGRSVQFINRYRYEARFRQNVKDNQVVDGYSFINRVRIMVGIKKTFGSDDAHFKPFVMVADEVLLNFGKKVTYNTFDQNRIMLSVGMQGKNIQYQVGFMNRFVQTGVSQYSLNHTVFFWVTHNLSFRKKSSQS